MEIATCPHCGGTLLVGEQSNDKNEAFRMRVNTTKLNSDIFDYVSDEEDTHEDAKSEKSNSPYWQGSQINAQEAMYKKTSLQ